MEVQWLGKKEIQYDGCLTVVNLCPHFYSEFKKEIENQETFYETLNTAHASGWCVYFVFENHWGITTIDEEFDYMEEYDSYWLSSKLFDKKIIDLKEDTLKNLSIKIEKNTKKLPSKICGMIAKNGIYTFLPPTSV